MTGRTPLQEMILAEGLEDLIPLPEIAETVRIRGLASSGSPIQEVSSALTTLLAEGLIQVWAGRWPAEPHVLGDAAAQELLALEAHYEFNSYADLDQRIYYVNVENLRVGDGDP